MLSLSLEFREILTRYVTPMFKRKLIAFSALLSLASAVSFAQAVTLDFSEARALAHERSDTVKMSASERAHREHEAESYKSLHGPKVTAEFRHLWGQKDVDLGNKQISLAGLGSLSVPLTFSQDLYGPRLIGSVELPIYTGGAISAKIAAAQAAATEALEDESATRNQLDVTLAQKYFGVQLARSVENLRRSMLSQQDEEVHRAKRLSETGSISRLENMAVGVNRDKAARELIASETDTRIAEGELKRLLREDSLGKLATPLFVIAGPIGTIQQWQTKAAMGNPVLRAVRAKRTQAEAGLKAAKAAWAPQVYAFAQGNAIKHYLSMTEPDWVAGVGVKITLWDNKDRSESMAAARALVNKATSGIQEAQNQIEQAVETAYLRTLQTQDQYQLTLSTLETARENLRLRKRAFEEGLCTATELNEARTQLLASEIARRISAYQFVVSWASLNAVCGSSDEFIASLSRKDNFVEN